mmetsp:Transcript_4746/g.13415  ORF Transcript_4746/g.13415 Transcript_4746/m.13415 type:complete len:234 (+) Transcript_4746:186-887(+)
MHTYTCLPNVGLSTKAQIAVLSCPSIIFGPPSPTYPGDCRSDFGQAWQGEGEHWKREPHRHLFQCHNTSHGWDDTCDHSARSPPSRHRSGVPSPRRMPRAWPSLSKRRWYHRRPGASRRESLSSARRRSAFPWRCDTAIHPEGLPGRTIQGRNVGLPPRRCRRLFHRIRVPSRSRRSPRRSGGMSSSSSSSVPLLPSRATVPLSQPSPGKYRNLPRPRQSRWGPKRIRRVDGG